MPNLPDVETLADQAALLQQNRFLRYLGGGAALMIIFPIPSAPADNTAKSNPPDD